MNNINVSKILFFASKNKFKFYHVKNQTPEICLAAVKQWEIALYYVIKQTEEICWLTINSTKVAIEYIKSYTKLVCNNGMII